MTFSQSSVSGLFGFELDLHGLLFAQHRLHEQPRSSLIWANDGLYPYMVIANIENLGTEYKLKVNLHVLDARKPAHFCLVAVGWCPSLLFAYVFSCG